ncbi:MAG: heme-binding domain-containing protein [Sphingobacteriales bacterium]|nr:heme-binding domain-containing protein [Sphingobacteriales bacterium]
MKKKIALIVILAILIIIQFFPASKNQNTELLASDITKVTTVPDDVLQVLKVACYDCHSNNTVYPWYNNIQPVAWWLNRHVEEGKEHLNFSSFGAYTAEKAAKKIRGIAREVEKGDMPLTSYTLIHRNAVLNETQKQAVINWTKSAVIAGLAH